MVACRIKTFQGHTEKAASHLQDKERVLSRNQSCRLLDLGLPATGTTSSQLQSGSCSLNYSEAELKRSKTIMSSQEDVPRGPDDRMKHAYWGDGQNRHLGPCGVKGSALPYMGALQAVLPPAQGACVCNLSPSWACPTLS
nr:uncharacterized protein LOC129491797 [Symphalangus syndactylus]